jgi:Mn-dependent DtxR family transcriptional regulator
MVVTEEESEKRILDVLEKHGELNTKQVARFAKMSPNTAAKYLMALHKADKVALREEKPYKKWRTVSRNKDTKRFMES